MLNRVSQITLLLQGITHASADGKESFSSLTFRLGTQCDGVPSSSSGCTNGQYIFSVCDVDDGTNPVHKEQCNCEFLKFMNIMKPKNCGWALWIDPDAPTDEPPTTTGDPGPTDPPESDVEMKASFRIEAGAWATAYADPAVWAATLEALEDTSSAEFTAILSAIETDVAKIRAIFSSLTGYKSVKVVAIRADTGVIKSVFFVIDVEVIVSSTTSVDHYGSLDALATAFVDLIEDAETVEAVIDSSGKICVDYDEDDSTITKCVGDDTDTPDVTTEASTTCGALPAPSGGGMECSIDGDKYSCQVTCNEGLVPEELLTEDVVETKAYCHDGKWTMELTKNCVPAVKACSYDTSKLTDSALLTYELSEPSSVAVSLASAFISLTCDEGHVFMKTGDRKEVAQCDCRMTEDLYYYCTRTCHDLDFGECVTEDEYEEDKDKKDIHDLLDLMTVEDSELSDMLDFKRHAFSSFMLSLFDTFLDKKNTASWIEAYYETKEAKDE